MLLACFRNRTLKAATEIHLTGAVLLRQHRSGLMKI
jgi:hypothetical protein